MKLEFNYRVETSDGKTHLFNDIDAATSFYDAHKKQLQHSHEHANTIIKDRWPILDRSTVAYNGQFDDYKAMKIETFCNTLLPL